MYLCVCVCKKKYGDRYNSTLRNTYINIYTRVHKTSFIYEYLINYEIYIKMVSIKYIPYSLSVYVSVCIKPTQK